MQLRLLLSTLLFAFIFNCFAEENDSSSIDNIRLIWTEAPSTHAIVAWNGDEGTVAYGKRGAALDQSAVITRSTNAKSMNNRFVHLNNLEANQSYELEIKTKNDTSKRYWFLTAPDKPSSFTFVAGGDSRNHHDARRRANVMVSKLRPLFVAFGGDMTSGDSDKEWVLWMQDWELTTGADGRLIPIVVTRGNHERKNESISNLFNTPHPSIHYATAIGGDFFRLYTLNTEIDVAGEQAKWLSQDLAAHKDVPWKLAQYHKPMWPHVSGKREGVKQYRAWAPLFYEYGFNLVMESDAHCVKTTWPIRPSMEEGSFQGFIRDDKRGTIFTGEGCWGAPIRAADDNKPWTRDSGSFNQFKWVHVHPDKMDVRTIPTDKSAEISVIDDSDPFAIPENLEIWNPKNGPLITLTPFADTKTSPEILNELKMIQVSVEIKVSDHDFKSECTVELLCDTDLPGNIHYSIDGSTPDANSPIYSEALTLDKTSMIQAAWITVKGVKSIVAADVITRIPEPVGVAGPAPQISLSSLKWIDQSAGWSETQVDKNIAKRELRIAGVSYKKGLGMHAVGHVSYACDPSWKRFVASVGLDDQVHAKRRSLGDVEVYADDVRIYRSPQPFGRLDLHHINVEIPANTKTIKIVAGDGGNGPGWDNVDVVNAGFLTD